MTLRPRSRLALLATAAFLAAPSLGCVERKLIVKPDPEDAIVFVDGRELEIDKDKGDASPTLRYEYYGIRRVVVRKEGYVGEERYVTLDPPWYQFFPIDLIFDVFWPGTIVDERTVEVHLGPRQDLADDAAGDRVLKNAQDFQTKNERHP